MLAVGPHGVHALARAAVDQPHVRGEKLPVSLVEEDALTILRKRDYAIQNAVLLTAFTRGARGVTVLDVGYPHSHGRRVSENQVLATEELALRRKHGLAILDCKYNRDSISKCLY